MKLYLSIALFFISFLGLPQDAYQPKKYVELQHPEWSKNATIYEVNLRQFTPEGTFKAFETHLPRLKALGVDIIWLMPIHPIGEKNRKGTLGSYYAVKDYYGVNPEYGSLTDFKALVDKIHAMGMHVILDWVANHSATDNALIKQHPDWYIKDEAGNFEPTPWRDYDDIIDFDYQQPGIRKYMTDALKYWVKETNIDGYRCDVASFIPLDFWENARKELDFIKPVFMLAESETFDLHRKAFDMTYAWSLWDCLHKITTKKMTIQSLTEGYIAEHVSIFPEAGYRMAFLDNHDKNSWEGNVFKNFGDGLKPAMVLIGTIDGMPMLYSGQESGLDRSLNFFGKDSITWKEHENGAIFKKLFELKHRNQALWNGDWGGKMVRIKNNQMSNVISFSRTKDKDNVIVIINFSDQAKEVILENEYHKGNFTEVFTSKKIELVGKDKLQLAPWGYLVLERN
ncbi:alpha-amylase family glycosyl hydrolase [Flavobacterium taihuense]|uniref:Alpha-glucosidase C-terminal domain-containing protein n=1 Tax=Flavobacterium taihuense TaxID=2857508 RepID=A0ABS6XR12_9FLAO|nr:alpha-amylase family glycosyl hydrolase [Flavobacterium taihuense]MBW4359084.1 alpha-glucosidase C-terminal domain-containing protein [Flavobacterium taihuense]